MCTIIDEKRTIIILHKLKIFQHIIKWNYWLFAFYHFSLSSVCYISGHSQLKPFSLLLYHILHIEDKQVIWGQICKIVDYKTCESRTYRILQMFYTAGGGGEVAQHAQCLGVHASNQKVGGLPHLCSACFLTIHSLSACYTNLLQPVLPTGSTKTVPCVIMYMW